MYIFDCINETVHLPYFCKLLKIYLLPFYKFSLSFFFFFFSSLYIRSLACKSLLFYVHISASTEAMKKVLS